MLKEIEDITFRLKFRLIELGVALPPPGIMTISILNQINMDFKQMSHELLGISSPLLFKNAQSVILNITGKYYLIDNVQQLWVALKKCLKYIESY